jgi:hypothetical protein
MPASRSHAYAKTSRSDFVWVRSATSAAPNFAVAALCVMIAHAGGSICWTSSTTLLQKITEDKFRGRVFSSEYAMSMLVLSTVTYACGVAIDAGWSPQQVCAISGVVILIPAAAWIGVTRHLK